jgi:hypothetical protein
VLALSWPINISADYSPLQHIPSFHEYANFFQSLGTRFHAAGDWMAKHTVWGYRLTTSKGRNLLIALQQKNLKILPTGEATYWPPDRNKTPHLLDFAITKGISEVHSHIESNFDLSSDHSPLIITISMNVIWKEPRPKLCTCSTNWQLFQETINNIIRLNHGIKEKPRAEKSSPLLNQINPRGSMANDTAPQKNGTKESKHTCTHSRLGNRQRRARRKWHQTRNPLDKATLNKLTHQLSATIQSARNDNFREYLTNLTSDDHSLWKATKKFKKPTIATPPIRTPDGTWARTDHEKVNTFAV